MDFAPPVATLFQYWPVPNRKSIVLAGAVGKWTSTMIFARSPRMPDQATINDAFYLCNDIEMAVVHLLLLIRFILPSDRNRMG
jgi:hypothetical protein